ncbi:MAG: GUN4 domain-containing protein [Xenococcaceae cyanobacterium MO_167.B27]|nr:GUN4 domain-containing protein [Xenococcaceae cyanobacterium MO_167.B27]
MSDRDPISQLSQQLSAIQDQLNQFAKRFDIIENQLDDLLPLSHKISQLEDKFLLVADGYRYQNLQQYLADANWFEADKETIRLILDVMGKEIEELTPEDIQHFPCKDLMAIDGLWLKYSENRFGFSPQLEVYQKVGGNFQTTIEQNQQIVETWGERLGWRKEGRWLPCQELDFSLNARKGCHPSRWWNSPYGSKMTNFFLGRLMSCDVSTNHE